MPAPSRTTDTKQNQKDPTRSAEAARENGEAATVFGTQHSLLSLHRSIGNRAFGQILQAKLAISSPGDVYEQEADRVADQVMRMSEPTVRRAAASRKQHEEYEDKHGLVQRKTTNFAPPSSPPALNHVQSNLGSSQPLDLQTRNFFEPRFGTDLGNVRVHTSAEANYAAERISATAFTLGNHIAFASGAYDPASNSGKKLLAHELAHIGQSANTAINRNIIHRKPSAGVDAESTPERVYFTITVPRGMTTYLQFLRYAEVQIFGSVVNLVWSLNGVRIGVTDPPPLTGKAQSVWVLKSSLEKYRAHGGASGPEAEKAKAEAKQEYGMLGGDKDAVTAEIDRRYYESTQETPGTKIKPGEKGKAVIWDSLMQKVIEDRKALENMPATVKSIMGESNFTPDNYETLVQIGTALSKLSEDELKGLFRVGPNGVMITPDSLPKLLSIANKLANMSPEARRDYLDRVNSGTNSLSEMEQSIDNYLQFRAEREEEVRKHEETVKPLLGSEDLYTLYRGYKSMKQNLSMAKALKGAAKDKAQAAESIDYLEGRANDLKTKLMAELSRKGFDSIEAFEQAIEAYRVSFRTQAINLALDVLARYEHMLFEESRSLQGGAAATIAQGIASTTASADYKEYHEQESTASNIWFAKEPKETWWQEPYRQAKNAAASAKASAEGNVLKGSGGDPLIKERGIDLEKLANADAAGVESYLKSEISRRQTDAAKARAEFKEDPDRVFKLPDLVAATYKILGVGEDTIYGRIIKDHISDEASRHLLSSIAIGILALALVFLVPGGGWVAAAALVGQAGLSTYQAYKAYKDYEQQQRDYELGFLSEEPSLFWVGLAVAAAALDLGITAAVLVKQSATALKALKGPMQQFAKDGELPTLLAKIEAADGLDVKFKAALAREAEASLAAKQSWKELAKMGMQANVSLFGMVDPKVAVQFFRALYHSVRRGINTITKLSAEAKFLEIAGDLTKMTGAERAQLETAFEEVKTLVRTGTSKGMDESSLVNFVDRWAMNRGDDALKARLLAEMDAWKPPTFANESSLKDLGWLGKDIKPGDKLPDGYHWKNGKIARNPGKKEANFAPLEASEGKLAIGDAGERISNPSAMKRNYEAELAKKMKKDNPGWTDTQVKTEVANQIKKESIHHIIPDNVVQDHPLAKLVRKQAGYDLDRGSNLLGMTRKDYTNVTAGEMGHWTSHPNYDAIVKGELNKAESLLIKEFGSLDKVPNDRLLKEMEKVEAIMRERLLRGDVPMKDGHLSFNESELEEGSQTAYA